MEFRKYFEDIIRRETPSHTMVKICWVNQQDMHIFDICYLDWLRALAAYEFDPSPGNLITFNTTNDKISTIIGISDGDHFWK